MATDYYMTPGGAGTKTGLTPGNAWDEAEFEQWAEGSAAPNPPVAVAGDKCYVGPGTYTFSSSVAAGQDGTAASSISVIGVTDLSNPTTTEAFGDSRPLFNLGAGIYQLYNDYWNIRNLRFSGNHATLYMLRLDLYSQATNCYAINAGAGAAFYSALQYTRWDRCEGVSAGGTAFVCASYAQKWVDCYAHDSVNGFSGLADYSACIRCIADTCSGTGFASVANADGQQFIENTAYNCGTAFTGLSTGTGNLYLRNIIDSCTASAVWDAASGTDRWDWNNWYNSGAPVNVTKGPNALAVDPKFVDAAGGDFRIRAAALQDIGLNRGTIGAMGPPATPPGLLQQQFVR